MHLIVVHDEIFKQIATCNDGYKFAAYPLSILQKFEVDEVKVTTEVPPETMKVASSTHIFP